MRGLASLAILLAVLAGPAGAQVSVTSHTPRIYGWWLGDALVQRIEIALPEDVRIDASSLPRPRSVTYWLDLRDVDLSEDGGKTVLTLRWQNFYAALEPRRRKVPSSQIRLSDGSEIELPGFEFVTSPIRPILAPSTPDQLRPDPAFRLVDTSMMRTQALAGSAVFVVALLLLSLNQAWWPFHRRASRPLTRAFRRIVRLAGDDVDARRRHLHRGLDATFGRVLIGSDLARFLQEKPQFAPLAARLEAFFADSDARSFGTPARACSEEDVVALARSLAAIERGRR